ncbi:MAG: cell division protein ZipA [Xanthomonadales bacterium]|nr:cell division protein ZipA [Xanthomonadales bacterium]
MDISTFRWVLVIAGVAIVAGIFLFGNPDRKRKPRASRKRVHAQRVRQEPALDSDQIEPEEGDDSGDTRQAELDIGLSSEDRLDAGMSSDSRIEPRLDNKPRKPAPPPPDKIVTLFLQARDNHIITGIELLDTSLKSGLVFGDHDIFHRIHEEDVEPVFSMANLTKPGSFDKNAWNTMEIQGVTMFMTLPGPRNALDAWDSMLATSRRLAELLHADLLDDQHEVFTRQRSLEIKEELREYERQKNPES